MCAYWRFNVAIVFILYIQNNLQIKNKDVTIFANKAKKLYLCNVISLKKENDLIIKLNINEK